VGQIAGTVLLLAVAGLVLATPGGAYVGQADPGPPPADDTTLIPPAALAGDELEDVDRLLPDPADGVFTVEGERNRTLVDVPPDAAEKLDEQLLDVADLLDRDLIADDGTVPVVLDAARAPAARLLDDPTRHEPFGLTSGRVAYPAIVDLARAPGVDHVHLDDRLQLQLDESVETVRADRLHEQRTDEGATITGDGVRIAIIDSGVDYAHERLGGCFGDGCKVAEGADYIEEDGDPMDEHGHGTHVAATAAGTRGVAPDATIHAYRVCDAGCPLSALLAAIEDAVEDDADVLSMSLGGPGTVDGPLASAADWAVDQGVPVVSAAGNSYGRWTVGEPAASLKGIAVGATNGDGGIAFFSSRGPVVDANGTVAGFKPDVAAPGVDVDAAVPTGDCPLCHPSGERELSGTSMATPHVSGAAALLLQAHPDWSPEQVKAALTGGAEDLGEHALAQGRGRLDALAAWNATVGLLPATAWTGIDLPTNDTYRTAPELTVHNLDDRQRQVDLEDATPAGASVGFEPASATLSAGGNATVQANLIVDNDAIPEGFHALDVTATADGTTSGAGLGFAHYHVLELDLDPDTNVVATYRGGDVRHLVSGPPEDLRLLAPSGTYDAAAFVDGCPADVDRCEDRSRSIALAEDRVPRGVLDLTLERSPAMHAVGYEASLLDGSSMPPEARHCSLADDTTACFGQWRDQLFPVGATSLLGYVGYGHDRTRYLDGASEEIVYGASLAYRHDGVDYAGGNATRGVQGDTTLTPTPLQTWEVGRELPPSYEEGAHRQRCYHAAYEATFDGGLQPTPWNGFAWDLGEAWVPVDGDGTQTVAFGGPAPDPVDWGTQRVGGVAAYPCQMVRQTVEAGEHEDRICRDDRGCPAVATSLYQDPHGGDPLQREPEYWYYGRDASFDDRHALDDGTIPLVDGAPTFDGWVTTEGTSLGLVAPRVTWFEPASGGLPWSPAALYPGFDERTQETARYEVRSDGDLVEAGELPAQDPSSLPERWIDLPQAGPVQLDVTADRALLDDEVGTATYTAAYETGDTYRRLPQLDWLRVTGDGRLDSRFGAAEDLHLYLKLQARSASVAELNVTLDGPAGGVTYPLDPDGRPTDRHDDVIEQDLVEMGPGRYELTVRMATDRSERVQLHQDPAFRVEAAGPCCSPVDPGALPGPGPTLDPGGVLDPRPEAAVPGR
jgi:subtilisin family serine protease